MRPCMISFQMRGDHVKGLALSTCHLPRRKGIKQGACMLGLPTQAGTVALPLFGGYCASKFGLEALSDSLR